MADEDDRDRMRRSFARYRVAPDFARELKPGPAAAGAPATAQPPVAAGRADDGGRRAFGRVPPPPPVAVDTQPAILELNPDYQGGLAAAKAEVHRRLEAIGAAITLKDHSRHYVFARIDLAAAQALAEDADAAAPPVYKVWRDEQLKPLLDRSVRTIKGDACLTAFGADGAGIVVAVADSGVDETHPHFAAHDNLTLPAGLEHRDFTGGEAPMIDNYGHGTHIAGIIAGATTSKTAGDMARIFEERDATDTVHTRATPMKKGAVLRGVAPKATILSLKVLDDQGAGQTSALIAALEHLEELNDYGRRIKVHCINLSLGYSFDARWYAAGQSPLCAVVNRISRSGVVVVAAAGNDGSAMLQPDGESTLKRIGLDQSINDPGNADEAITVGATHGEAPHRYGVSFFSSRGPTADGRVKPDLVAPGERILSCAAAGSIQTLAALDEAGATAASGVAYFREESGTSMAAPHVAGAVAALLSVRSEYVGRPEAVKAILLATCTDLKRRADFQGAGLLDMMRALQSI